MQYPRVKSASAIDERTLLIEFNNHVRKMYDMTQLFDKEIFSPLKNPALFKSVKVELGGYAVSWNSDIDISEYELWKNGQSMP